MPHDPDCGEQVTLSIASEGTPEYEIIPYLEADYLARRDTLQIANESGIFIDFQSAQAYVKSIPRILPDGFPITYDDSTLQSQLTVIGSLAAMDLPIAPMPEAVTPISIPSVEPQIDGTESDLIVVVDILFETLGISVGESSLIIAFVESDDRIQARVSELLERVSTKDWREVILTAEELFKLFVKSSFFRNQWILRKLSFRLALKCVPVVGWIYCRAAFVVSVSKNWHRFSFA